MKQARTGILILVVLLITSDGLLNAQSSQSLLIGPQSSAAANLFDAVMRHDEFGAALASPGDLDGDGQPDLLVGAPGTNVHETDEGAVYVLFLARDRVREFRRIDGDHPVLEGRIQGGDDFGASIAYAGDFTGDGNKEFAVGAPGDNGKRGAVWILSLAPNGELIAAAEISSETVDDFRPDQCSDTEFDRGLCRRNKLGTSVCTMNDLDGDGVPELVAGAPEDETAGSQAGAIWILQLEVRNDTIDVARTRVEKVIADYGRDANSGLFGHSVAESNDVNGDGIQDLVIAAPKASLYGGSSGGIIGAVVDPVGTVSSQQILDEGAAESARAGWAIATVGDVDGNGYRDLAVGMREVENGGKARGDVEILFLWGDGVIRGWSSMSAAHDPALHDFDKFGSAVAFMPDFNGDGVDDIAVGAPGYLDDWGAVWLMSPPTPESPQIGQPQVTPSSPTVDDEIVVSAEVSEPGSEVRLHIRRAGESVFSSVPMKGDPTFRATVPTVMLSSRGLEYYVEAENENGFRSRYPASGFGSIRLTVSEWGSFPIRHGSEQSAYRLFSIPLELSDPSASSLFEEEFGPYDIRNWRFFRPVGIVNTELSEEDIQIRPGRAYWLIVKEPGHVFPTGQGTTISTDRPFKVQLDSGWNFVGSPFNYSLPRTAFRSTGGRQLEVMRRSGPDWIEENERIVPFEGYAVRVVGESAIDSLVIDPHPEDGYEAIARTENRAPSTETKAIQVMATKNEARDANNYAVIVSEQEKAIQIWDRSEPPVIGDYVRVAFECDRDVSCSSDRRIQAKALLDGEVTWTVVLSSATPGRALLRFERMADLPDSLSANLIDQEANVTLDLRRTQEYPVALRGTSSTRRFRLVVADRKVRDERLEAERLSLPPSRLTDVFPNPFRDVVTAGYSLDVPSRIQLDVFDLLGRKVDTIIDQASHPAGVFVEVWDPGSIAPGVYILALSADDHRIDSKTILLAQ